MYSNNLKEQFLGFYQTPSLFNNTIGGLENFEFDEIDINSLDFSKFEIAEKIPLGKRVERFFEFYIINSKRYDIVLKNIQIIENKNTFGEIDFILFDNKDKEFLHVELVYKFYIYETIFKYELDRYIGPNREDTLVKKLTKLRDHQLPLLYKRESKSYLQDINLENIKQKICFKGNLFFSNETYNQNIEPLNDNCKKGFYIRYQDFINGETFKNLKFYLPHRYDWLCNSNIIDKWFSYNDIINEIDYFIKLKRSPLIYINTEDGIKQYFILW